VLISCWYSRTGFLTPLSCLVPIRT
jgi:hypothetical protein